MEGIMPYVRCSVKERLYKHLQQSCDAKLKTRYLIVVNLIHKRSPKDTADALGVSLSTVYRVAERFREYGEIGLLDRREDNGDRKLDEVYLATLYKVVRCNPQQDGWRRPTWTREMLVETMRKKTGVRIHVASMSRALRLVHARRGRPKATVGCPWSESAKRRRLRAIRQMLDNRALSPVKPTLDGEPCYEDHPIKGDTWRRRNQPGVLLEWFDEWNVRRAAYMSMLAGASGHTYGNHNIWQMWLPGREPLSMARTPWPEALHHPGALQMKYFRGLFEARPFHRMQPDQSLLVGENPEGPDHVRAARESRGAYALVYIPTGKPVTVRLERIRGEQLRAYWFNPRQNSAQLIGDFRRKGPRKFTPPTSGRNNDWVLVVEDGSAAGSEDAVPTCPDWDPATRTSSPRLPSEKTPVAGGGVSVPRSEGRNNMGPQYLRAGLAALLSVIWASLPAQKTLSSLSREPESRPTPSKAGPMRLVLAEFDGKHDSGRWDIHHYGRPDGKFRYEVRWDALVMFDKENRNQHLTRRGFVLDPKSQYAVKACFKTKKSARNPNSFCLNFQIAGDTSVFAAGGTGTFEPICCWSINVSVEPDKTPDPQRGGVMFNMGFLSDRFRRVGKVPVQKWCAFDTEYKLRVEVNADDKGEYRFKFVTVTASPLPAAP